MNPSDDIATGAWTRLRNLIGALDRLEMSSVLSIGSRISAGKVQFASVLKPIG